MLVYTVCEYHSYLNKIANVGLRCRTDLPVLPTSVIEKLLELSDMWNFLKAAS